MNKEKLCYIDNETAYFTTIQELSDQWGDDWDDAPYEHNAGTPYEYGPHRDGDEYKILKVKFDGELETPSDIANGNSSYSVQDINSGAIAWLITSRYSSRPKVAIHAGIDIETFEKLVTKAGGKVYFPRQ